MCEAEFGGVKKIPAERRERELSNAELRSRAVECVTDDGMLDGGEVHANLMRTARVELDFDECRRVDRGEGAPVGESFAGIDAGAGPAAAMMGGHASSALGIAADGKVNAAVFALE